MRSLQLVGFAILTTVAALTPTPATGNTVADEFLIWANRSFGSLLARASNTEAVEYARLVSDTAVHLAATDPRRCVQMLFPSIHGPLSREQWPEKFLDRQMTLQRKIVKTALNSPNRVPTESDAGPTFDKVLDAIETKYGASEIKRLNMPDGNSQFKESCLAWAHLYGELASLPSHQGGVVVRWLNAP